MSVRAERARRVLPSSVGAGAGEQTAARVDDLAGDPAGGVGGEDGATSLPDLIAQALAASFGADLATGRSD
jgi:hypothetical protein